MKSVLRVLDPGTYTTVQDAGRLGYRQFGIPPAGCLDRFAHRVANILAGNPDNAAVFEMTFKGGSFDILDDVDMALTGADMPVILNNRKVAPWRTFRAKAGDHLSIGQARSGCRSYLAITGGIDVPVVMGSLSSYVGARVGGYGGRALYRGDTIAGFDLDRVNEIRSLPVNWIPRYASEVTLRAVPGPQAAFFKESSTAFYKSTYMVSSQADRKGYRLEGNEIRIHRDMPKSIISEPCLAGCVQVPENGQPIILLNEQTVGGYAKIATVISADLNLIAQTMPGDRIRFEAVDIETAYTAANQQYQRLEMLRQKIVAAPALKKSARALWNLDPDLFCRRVHRRLNQMRTSQRTNTRTSVS